jgi:YebC/PmpR family DNA-binding regulatory protein
VAGHSKWANIKHRKAAVDAKRGKLWSKCAKAIMVAAKNGGSDPTTNLTLRYAIDEARYANMPRDTIERAAKKGAGELGAEDYEEIRYEAYGPGGVAIIADALTNNRTRTASDLRSIFSKHGGNLGQSGSVAFQFDSRGQIAVAAAGVDADRVMEAAIEAGAEDVREPGGPDLPWTIVTNPTEFQGVKVAIERSGLNIVEASLTMLPNVTVSVSGEDAAKIIRLIDALEDNDDVQKVYANFEIPDDELAALTE